VKAPRSAAQVAASRRNGARSRGPCGAAAKAVSSRNAVKHGLFRKRLDGDPDANEVNSELVQQLRQDAAGDLDSLCLETILVANRQLNDAAALVHALQRQVTDLIATAHAEAPIDETVVQLWRMARYQRRFRGQRDRALRALGSVPAHR
jgi:hypothetical protein